MVIFKLASILFLQRRFSGLKAAEQSRSVLEHTFATPDLDISSKGYCTLYVSIAQPTLRCFVILAGRSEALHMTGVFQVTAPKVVLECGSCGCGDFYQSYVCDVQRLDGCPFAVS